MQTLMLVDGNSILNRAYYGIPLLSNREGFHTNAIYGFFNILLRHLEEERPEEVCVAFDVKAPTYRNDLYAHYKEGRKPMPEELREQFPVVKELLDMLGLHRFEQAGLEADDILGILSHRAEKEGKRCVIVTGDRDSLQLIRDNTVVRLAAASPKGPSDILYDKAMLQEKYGLKPEQMIDLKALMGDSSDKIPGIAGIGEKTALNLLHQYGTLDQIFEHSGELKGALRTKIENGRESAELSKKLGTIVTESDLDFGNLTVKESDRDALTALLSRYELNKLAARLNLDLTKPQSPKPQETERTHRPLNPGESLPEPLFLTFDGTKLHLLSGDEILDASLSDELLKTVSEKEFVTHHAKPLIKKLEEAGLPNRCRFDTMLALYVLDPSRANQTLQEICRQELNKSTTESDVTALLPELYQKLSSELEENNAQFLYREIELPLCTVLARMETIGFRADKEFLSRFSQELDEELKTFEQEVYQYAGREFNIYSPKQLGEILFTELMLPAGRKTKTGYSTDNETLERLSRYHPIAQAVINCRRIAKLKATYADGLSEKIEPDGRIHTVFMQAVTQTGRISSVEPNLQNIPIRTEQGRQMRKAFSAAEGCSLVDADYSQIELRLLAHIADDPTMQAAFREGDDIHTATASQVFDLPPEMITPELRSRAKAVNFGIVYGIGGYSLGQDLHISTKEAQQYIDAYLNTYPGVRNYMNRTVAFGKEHGYVETLFHRRRYVPELNGKGALKAFGERVCMNAPIQGTAADLIKYAMVRVDRRLKEEGLKTRLILQIHDELILEAPDGEAKQAEQILKEEMESAAELRVPLKADSKIAKNWFDTK